MAITDKQLSDIKNIIKEFKNNNSFVDSEDHVQASYTLPILQAIDWKPSNWKINKGQDIKTGKRPDILLKGSGGGSVFVIESKEPKTPKGLNGKYQKWTFAEQLCYYCGSEGVSWGLLTNFIEWRIYNINAYASNESIYKTLTVFKDNEICCTDNELRDFFSLINFVFLYYNKGKLSADVVYYKKEYEIKEEFFQNLKIWRNDLRKFILKKYNSLSAEEIDYYTQKILDRLIFIDVCYNKEIISQDVLGAVLFSEKSYYYELKKKFREFEDRYNSELFSFEECDKFDIPDNELEKIIKGINHTDFSNLSVHIIGEVYENYLGELLKASKNASVITEHKEHLKRKAQGIYYTPDFIVNYIIANTVGKLLGKCNTVKDIEKIKVLDIACGSGSFLIRAFDVFYEAYKSKINKGKKELHIFDELEIRKKILLHNLYGVDLDERAVEIAKLNLLLRAVEEIKYIDTNMEERKLLPNLSLNIRHGNSLISGIYEEASEKYTAGAQLDFIFDKNSEYKTNIKRLIELKNEFYLEEDNIKKEKIIFDIRKHEEIINKHLNEGLKKYFSVPEKYKPFNYEVSFCEVMKNGGFDCIIGNPPYVIVKGGRYTGFEESKSVINYYKTEYDTLQQQINIYIAFLEKTNKLSKENGLVGLIIPNTILTNDYCVNIRKYLLKNTCINILNNVGQVFSGAVVEALVIIFSKSQKSNILTAIHQKKENKIKQIIFNNIYLNRFLLHLNPSIITIIEKCNLAKHKLRDVAEIWRGLTTGNDNKYLSETKISKSYKKIVQGKQIKRFFIENNELYVNYLENELDRPRPRYIFEQKEKIISKFIGKRLEFAYDTNQLFVINTCVVIFLRNTNLYNTKYLLGILNSRLINFYFFNLFTDYRDIFPIIKSGHLEEIPIKEINLKKPAEKSSYDKLVKLVDEMLELNKNPEKNKIKTAATDSEIDSLVYKLYNISKAEQKIIENKI